MQFPRLGQGQEQGAVEPALNGVGERGQVYLLEQRAQRAGAQSLG
jgi:hypothetical protein